MDQASTADELLWRFATTGEGTLGYTMYKRL